MTLAESARPLALDGDGTGVLLVHGFTGSPASMVPWARYLHERSGATVRVPRLPGHGTTWQELNRTRWEDWYAEADRALTALRERCDRVMIGGLSMGGALSLRLAQQRPDDVDALVLVNPAINLLDRRLVALPVLRHLVPSIAGIGGDIKKQGVLEKSYDRTPTHALWSQTHLWRDVRDHLGDVRAPLLLVRSVVDHVLDASSSRLVAERVPSFEREVLLHDSYHVATIDHDAETVWSESLAFLEQHVSHVG